MEETQNQSAPHNGSHSDSGKEKFTCAKCGKEKSKDQGHFMLEGKAFCCEKCCKEGEEKTANVCEFC